MKRIIFAFIITLATLPAMAQKEFANLFKDIKGTQVVYLTKDVLDLMPKDGRQSVNPNESVMKKMDYMEVINSPDDYLLSIRFEERATKYLEKQQYEQIMDVDEKDNKTKILFKEKNRKTRTFVLLTKAHNKATLIAITGSLKLEGFKKMVKSK